MSTSTTVLADDLGPRGKRNVLIASIVAALAIVALLVVALQRLNDTGQLDRIKWEPLTQWPVQKFLLLGLVTTLKVAAVSMVLAMLIGALMALGRLAKNGPTRWLAGIYVELFSALPLLLLILFSFIALPRYGLAFDPFWYLVMGLVLYNSAMLAEVFRAGILSLDRGQSEAAMSLGMTYWQSMLLVVIPQAARRMIPSIVSQLVVLMKDTSLGFVIAVEELLRRGRSTGEFFVNPLQTLVVVALMYLIVSVSLSRFAIYLGNRQRRKPRAASPPIVMTPAQEGLV